MEVAWKCSTAFVLGVATHYVVTKYLLRDRNGCAPNDRSDDGDEPLDDGSSSGEDYESEEETKWAPHKMVLCVRTDLGMGKGKMAAQCCHATLGAFKRAIKRTPNAVRAWEMLGQAKVCVKVGSEEELLQLAQIAAAKGLVHYVVVDAGRTQIAPDSKTVLAIGPALVESVDEVTKQLKLL